VTAKVELLTEERGTTGLFGTLDLADIRGVPDSARRAPSRSRSPNFTTSCSSTAWPPVV
jgi:hypothetical protein